MKKGCVLLATAIATICLAAPLSVEAATVADKGEWKKDDTGYWYQVGDTFLKSGVFTVEGGTYSFDDNGYLVTGWVKDTNEWGGEIWRYTDENGFNALGWKEIDGEFYYFDENGVMESSEWVKDGADYYYMGSTGAMVTDTVQWAWDEGSEKGKYYAFGEDGKMLTAGWHFVDGGWLVVGTDNAVITNEWYQAGEQWYYLTGSGYMNTSSYNVYDEDGKYVTSYLFRPDGTMITGWYNRSDAFDVHSDWVYTNEDGTAYTGWIQSGTDWYYVYRGVLETSSYISNVENEDGTTEFKVGDYSDAVSKYYVDKDGKMITGWYNDTYSSPSYSKSTWLYADASGELHDGWLQEGGKWYFINGGRMVRFGSYTDDTNAPKLEDFAAYGSAKWDKYNEAREEYVDNNTWVFGNDGALVTGWYSYSTSESTDWYYATSEGRAYDGWLQEGGKWYYIDNGYMLTNCYTEDGYFVGADGTLQ